MPIIIESTAWSWEEAFDKFGFGDGDGQVMTDVVAEVLRGAGYTVVVEPWCLHNVVIGSIKNAAGEELIPDKFDFVDDNPRDHLPEAIIKLLDADPRTGAEVAPMSNQKTYLVTFCVADCYRITLTAASGGEAIERAQNLYDAEHEAAFEFDITGGGASDWDATEVQA